MRPPVLLLDDVAALFNPPVKAKTISTYLSGSRPGGRYESHPFPAPDARIGRAPYWRRERADEIKAWAASRAGQGAGGGPKTL